MEIEHDYCMILKSSFYLDNLLTCLKSALFGRHTETNFYQLLWGGKSGDDDLISNC